MDGATELRVAALQLPHRFGDVEGALARVDALLADAPAGTDLVLLPEAAFTGYVSPAGDFDLTPFAEPRSGPTARALAELAVRHRVALAGPLIERDGGRAYNSVLVFGPDGALLAHYRKRHPWYPERWATAGTERPPLFALKGRALSVAVCFDAHFVAREAANVLRAADVLLFPSAWVEAPPDSRPRLLGGIARRFGLTVVNANWARSRPALHGQGGSAISGPGGDVVARARSLDAEFVSAAVPAE